MKRPGKGRPVDDVFSLTSARRPHSDDLGARQRRYIISMTIRTICFGLAVVVDGPMRWVFLFGAVLLPYVAVVAANAGRESSGPGPEAPVLTTPALPPPTSPPAAAVGRTVDGESGMRSSEQAERHWQ